MCTPSEGDADPRPRSRAIAIRGKKHGSLYQPMEVPYAVFSFFPFLP